MNNPEHYITDIMREVVAAAGVKLAMALHFEHGNITEINKTLLEWSEDPIKAPLKFPLVWFFEPYTIRHDSTLSEWGKLTDGRILIVKDTLKEWKAEDRLINVFKPVIDPIRRELINQICLNRKLTFVTPQTLQYEETKRYYFQENGQTRSAFNDIVDAAEISRIQVGIKNNKNC